MKIRYTRPINEANIEKLSYDTEKAMEHIRVVGKIDHIVSPIMFVLHMFLTPAAYLLFVAFTEYGYFLKPMEKLPVLSNYLNLALSMDDVFSFIGIHSAITVLAISFLAPVIVCAPVGIALYFALRKKVTSPLVGIDDNQARARCLCDRVDALRKTKLNSTKGIWTHQTGVLSFVLCAAYLAFVKLQNPGIESDLIYYIFVSLLISLLVGVFSYFIARFSKALLSLICDLKPRIDAKKLKKDATAYRLSLDIVSIVDHAIQDKSFFLNFQPIRWMEDGQYHSAEALARLETPVYGRIPPDVFIAAAEKCHRVTEITDIILHSACQVIARPDFEKLGLRYINVNLSVLDCLRKHRMEDLISVVDSYGIPHSHICFELTESAAASSEEMLWNNIEKLSDAGFMVALDDFGSGYSSLSRVIHESFNIVKIDRTLIFERNNQSHRTLLIDIVNLLKNQNKKIVLEGVETVEHVNLVRELGIDYIQGFYYSTPLSTDDFITFLRLHNKITETAGETVPQ